MTAEEAGAPGVVALEERIRTLEDRARAAETRAAVAEAIAAERAARIDDLLRTRPAEGIAPFAPRPLSDAEIDRALEIAALYSGTTRSELLEDLVGVVALHMIEVAAAEFGIPLESVRGVLRRWMDKAAREWIEDRPP